MKLARQWYRAMKLFGQSQDEIISRHGATRLKQSWRKSDRLKRLQKKGQKE